jgi:Mg/Co/Ni transporter MgtE
MDHSVAAVVEDGELVGVIAQEVLESAERGISVGDLMDDPVFLEVGDSYEEAARLAGLFRGAPIPVVDADGRLVGSVTAPVN